MAEEFMRRIGIAAGCVIVLMTGLYFRTYRVQPEGLRRFSNPQIQAEELVQKSIRQQLKQRLIQTQPDIPFERVDALVEARADNLMRSDPVNYQLAVKRTLAQMGFQDTPGVSRPYLLGADSYHFLALTQNVLDQGTLAEQSRWGKYYNPLRQAPKGVWSPVNWHPVLGALWVNFGRAYGYDGSVMGWLGYIPIILTVFVFFSFLFFAHACRMRGLEIFFGGLSLVLAPILIQRSAYGWYDTDPYHLLFSFTVFALILKAASLQGRRVALAGIAAGVLSGIYARFWVGWLFLPGLVMASSLAVLVLSRWIPRRGLPGLGTVLTGYIPALGITAFALVGPEGIMETVRDALTYLPMFGADTYELWPNIFLTVGETKSTTLKELLFITGHLGTGILAMGGFLGAAWLSWKEHKGFYRDRWVMMAVVTLPLLYLSLKTERFALLFVFPLVFWICRGAGVVQVLAEGIAARWLSRARGILVSAILFPVFFITLVPFQVLLAHSVGSRLPLIMNDAWYGGMKLIREKTPADAVILNWWPPGHFITALGERKVFTDGGTQHLPECYWTARFFMTGNESEARGILRMLMASGNDAVDFLLSRGMTLPDAIDVMNLFLPLERAQAEEMPIASMDAASRKEFLDLIYGKAPPGPASVFLFNEMVEKNLAMSLLARWNFHKAEEIARRSRSGALERSGKDPVQDYINRTISISEGILKYTKEMPVSEKQGELYYFGNGVILNPGTKEARLVIPEEKIDGIPVAVYWLEDGRLKRKIQKDGRVIEAGVLFFQREGEDYTVLAHPSLIESMLYRMYYLEGAGIDFLELAGKSVDPVAETEIYLFTVQWDTDITGGF